MLKKERGITLIALVITIIVMLILAGVVVIALVGDNGLIKISIEGAEKTKIETYREKIIVAVTGTIDERGNLYADKTKNAISSDVENTEVLNDEFTLIVIAEDKYVFEVEYNGNVTYQGVDNGEKPEIEIGNKSINSEKTIAFVEVIVTKKVNNGSIIVFVDGRQVESTNNRNVYVVELNKNKIFSIYVKEEGIYRKSEEKQVEITELISIIPEGWEDCSTNDPEWYSYIDLNSGVEAKVNPPNLYSNSLIPIKYIAEEPGDGSMWANAITKNGSMLVWIPRYAYKITYYKDNNKSVVKGYRTSKGYETLNGTIYDATIANNQVITSNVFTKYISIDIVFLDGISNNLPSGYEDYIIHPAFNFGGKQLDGIWMGKFETSDKTASYTNVSNISKGEINIIPNVRSIVSLNLKDMFYKAKTFDTSSMDAHIAKNIDWGAVVYLSYSKYGTNGITVASNGHGKGVTGAGVNHSISSNGSIYEVTKDEFLTKYAYNTTYGKRTSTTGNVFGIYDMASGNNDTVMGIHQSVLENPTKTGFTLEEIQQLDEKYYNLYTNTSKDPSNTGDALFETAGVNSNSASFVNTSSNIFIRGGSINLQFQSFTGIFASDTSDGTSNAVRSFRMVCTEK